MQKSLNQIVCKVAGSHFELGGKQSHPHLESRPQIEPLNKHLAAFPKPGAKESQCLVS